MSKKYIVNVVLDENQYNALLEMAVKQGLSKDECLRMPIDSYLALKDSGIDLFMLAQELGEGGNDVS